MFGFDLGKTSGIGAKLQIIALAFYIVLEVVVIVYVGIWIARGY